MIISSMGELLHLDVFGKTVLKLNSQNIRRSVCPILRTTEPKYNRNYSPKAGHKVNMEF